MGTSLCAENASAHRLPPEGYRVLLLLLVALSMGLSNFAGAIAIGVNGVDARTRASVGTVFGLFEAGMPLVGLLAGHTVAHAVGGTSRWVASALLIAAGAWPLVQAVRHNAGAGAAPEMPAPRWRRLLVTGFAPSIDNLAVGFALGAYRVNVLLAVVLIAAVSVGLSLAGLEIGARLGARASGRGEVLGGVLLLAVGAAVAAGAL